MNFLLYSDDKYFHGLITCISSIIIHNHDNRIVFFVIEDGISKQHLQTLRNQVANFEKVTLNISSSNVLKDSLKELIPSDGSISPYLRLFVDKIIKREERVICIDSDLLVLKDISRVWNMKLDGNIVAACPDFGVKSLKDDPSIREILQGDSYLLNNGYFNSGFLLIDLEKWKENKVSEKINKIISENKGVKFSFWDQSILNLLLSDKVYFLEDSTYNLPYDRLDYLEKYNSEIKRRDVNFHYIYGDKPWLTYKNKVNFSYWRTFYAKHVNWYPDYVFTRHFFKVSVRGFLQENKRLLNLYKTITNK